MKDHKFGIRGENKTSAITHRRHVDLCCTILKYSATDAHSCGKTMTTHSTLFANSSLVVTIYLFRYSILLNAAKTKGSDRRIVLDQSSTLWRPVCFQIHFSANSSLDEMANHRTPLGRVNRYRTVLFYTAQWQLTY